MGGVTEGFMVSKKLLCTNPGSTLSAMFSGRHDLPRVNGAIFLDRNPKVFVHVINYLRSGRNPLLENKNDEMLYEAELNFWGLAPKTEDPFSDQQRAYIESLQAIFDKEIKEDNF